MSLAQRLTDFAQTVALDVKALFARSLPTGGTVGQVLTKNSANSYDASWQTAGGSISISAGIYQQTVNIPTGEHKQAEVSIAFPGVLSSNVVSCFLVPNLEWDVDDLADLTVSGQAGTDAITFLISRNGPIVGDFLIAYKVE